MEALQLEKAVLLVINYAQHTQFSTIAASSVSY